MSIAKDFASSIKDATKEKTSSYDTQATVTRIEGKTAWVHIPGGVTETPVQLTVNASEGDAVQVRVANGKAWITGNASAPPTDDKLATQANNNAEIANNNALTAGLLAQGAEKSAQIAREAASSAQADANTARTAADSAQRDATSAYSSASNALDQLSVVESVVGVLDLLSKHGTYTEITYTGAEAEEGKWYFTRSGSGTTADPYVYSTVNVNVGDSVVGYYELTDIDQAVTNYVSSHLALTDDGLYLQQDGSPYRILINTNGLSIIGANGVTVASYGTDTVIGDQKKFHVKITGTELGFYQGSQRVAYINNNQLYITQSVVLQQMDLGTPVSNGGLGQWSWKVHANGQTPSRNNLNLKWIG